MKIAICTQGKNPAAPVDPRFGRCNFFALVDTEQEKWEFIPNPGGAAGGGAGIQAAQELVKREVEAVLAGRVGPNATAVLQAAGVAVYTTTAGTVEEAYRQFLRQEQKPLTAANAPPHAGIKER